ncbi:MAG: endonuclease VIII [Lachnospiraceae bacterium]|nr:endonuclease VIII [Lachnospiraceae bacterium]
MLEIPESTVIARQLNETVKGKKIKEVEAEHTKHSFAWYHGDPADYAAKMEEREIGNSTGIGSMIETELSEYSFITGDGANIRYFAPGEKLPDRYQTRITLEDDSSLIITVQMYGAMFLIDPETYDNPYYLAGKEKPLPGTEDFDYEYFTALREDLSGKISVKEFLATHQRIPGLGNGVLQDILFEAGLYPKRKINTLKDADFRRTYEAILHVLKQMTDLGGRDTEKDLFGQPGRYLTKLSKKTAGKPCPYCGNLIQKANYLGGTVYYCPSCQE